MKCLACQHENREGAKFCEECAAPLKRGCSRCGGELRPTAKFCDECGTPVIPSQAAEPAVRRVADYTPVHLAERIRAAQAALEARGATDGERKTITALFADLKGSTALIEGLDPEEVRAIIDPALQLMMDAVHQYDGYVAQALGDGIFALFGAPLAHEDHPQRAIYAALRMQEAMGRYADTLRAKGYPPLQMRVGLNTGEVVVRSIRKDDLHTDYVPVGHSTNLAARMEQLANPGTIVVSAHTHRLTDGYFAFKDLGPTQIKGVEAPLNIYEVLSVGPLRTRLQMSARRGLTRFVGRQSEMEQLQRALAQAKTGHGQLVGVMGEPGLGKSRLFYEFKLLAVGGCLVLEAYSVSHGKATAYLPVIELLKSYFDIQSLDNERKRREKITGKVLNLDRSLEDTLPYLFALLGIEAQPSPLQQMDAQIRRRRTFEALKKLLLRESLNQPLILVFEDLHWIDGETQGLLDALSESVAGAKLLLLTNYRPEYRHEWGQKTYYTQLRLAPLGQAEAAELLTFLLGGDASLTQVKQLILEKTQGTPFFMEEVVQTLVEDGTLAGTPGQYRLTRPVSTLQLPSTVQAILAARIDRLAPDEKALLQQLAVIGREFPLSLVRQVITQPETELYRLLASLQHKEFLYEQPAFPEVEYIFKHALTQEVAYGAVLQDHKKALHEKVALAIEILFQANLDEHYATLAHHYGRSGNLDKAIEYHYLAGEQAGHRCANLEAVRLLESALEMIGRLPDPVTRGQQEIRIQLSLATPVFILQGHSSERAELIYQRVLDLCGERGHSDAVFSALLGLHVVKLQQAKISATRDLASKLLQTAHDRAEPGQVRDALVAAGISAIHAGELLAGQDYLARAVALEIPQERRWMGNAWADYGLFARSYGAKAQAFSGYVDHAATLSAETLGLAAQAGHPPILACVLYTELVIHVARREWEIVRDRAEMQLKLATEHGMPLYEGWGLFFAGLSCAELGDVESGITSMRASIAAFEAIKSELLRPYCLVLFAAMMGKQNRFTEALLLLEEALQRVSASGEHFYESEIHRLQGELLLQSGMSAEGGAVGQQAESHFIRALEVARLQSARLLELRAATSLARVWVAQSRRAEALGVLTDAYTWFTEGFETKDLQEAKALLEELSTAGLVDN